MKLIQNSEIRVFKSGIPQKSSTVDIMSWIHSLGPPKRISSNIGPILQRSKNFEKLGNDFDMKLIQNSETRVFKSGIPQKPFNVDKMSWKHSLHSLGPPREPVAIWDRFCRDLRISKKIGNDFDMKLIQNSETRVFKSGIPQKSSTVDIMSWIHSLGPPKRISSNIGPILQRSKNFEKLGNDFDMKLIQNSETRVFKSGIPQKPFNVDKMSWKHSLHSLGPPREPVAIWDRFCRDLRISKKIGNDFDMKLIQNSETRVFESRITRKSSTVNTMSWIHSLGPPKRISSKMGPILQR